MSEQLDRVILETGSGVSMHGADYTKAACRAVLDAIHHSSLNLLGELGLDPDTDLKVRVIIGVADPDAVDVEKVRGLLPHGEVSVHVTKGGLNVPYPEKGEQTTIASAAVEAWIDMSPFRP